MESATKDMNMENGARLPYRLAAHRKNWALWMMFFNFDGCVLPIVLFYSLWFGSKLSPWSILAIITSLCFWTSYHKWFSRGWRLLLVKAPTYRPINGRRWAFDCSYYILSAALLAMILELVIATSTKDVKVPVIAMAPPSTLYTIMLYLLVQNTAYCIGMRAPLTISSIKRGALVPPPLFTVMEDVFAVDGCHMGLPAREAMLAMYHGSPRFRRTLMWWSWIWCVGCGVVAIALSVVVGLTPQTVSFGITYAVSWPFITIMTIITARHMERLDAQGVFLPDSTLLDSSQLRPTVQKPNGTVPRRRESFPAQE